MNEPTDYAQSEQERVESDIPSTSSNSIRFTLPSLPPSVNSLYQIIYSQRRVELKPECRRWKTEAKEYIPRFVVAEDSFIKVAFVFHYPFYHRNNRLRMFDTPNLLQLLFNAIKEKTGIDDSRMKDFTVRSVNAENERVDVMMIEVRREKPG